MKPKHKDGIRQSAAIALHLMNIGIGQDFHTLSSLQVDLLLAEADRVRYQKPKNANGSKARYFHDRLQRQASMK